MVATKDESRGELDTITDTDSHKGDSKTGSVSTAVVEAVSDVTETPPVQLNPLYNAVNPDALDLLFKPTHSGAPRENEGEITFTYNECRVTVFADGDVEVQHLSHE